MKTVCVTIIALVRLIAAVSATDYCSPSLCSGGKHIGCGNTGAFGAACPAGKAVMVTMTDSLKQKIIDSHNSKRNTIAGGKLSGFKSAERMPTMRWDNELERLASFNVKRCKFEHDQCRNTNAFKYSGQNLGKLWWSGINYSDEQAILPRIDDWWAEYKNAQMSQIDNYPSSSSKTIGHFTVMTADKNIALGCAAIRFPENNMNSVTLACNYATTNIINRRLYKSGTTASKCTTGKNPKYPALCSLSESINVNDI